VRDVYIAGVGQTAISKDATLLDYELGVAALKVALDDAAISPEQVDALFIGNMMSGMLAHQQQLGALLADYAGMRGVDAVTLEAACASGAEAARLGYLTVASGVNDIAVVCGLERMTHVDQDTVTRALATAADWQLEGSCGETFVSLNAKLMRAYMQAYGARAEDFAPFSITAHKNALTNPNALLHKRVDLGDYLASRIIVDPVRLFDASPICNGSAAIVLACAERMEGLQSTLPHVRIVGSAAATDSLALSRRAELLHLEAVAASTRKALDQAGAEHEDMDLLELHDAYTIMTVLSLESGGFAAPGAGTELGAGGRIELSGDLPLSTMGGLKARGHPVGATGVYQLVEAYLQLAGRAGPNQISDPELALAQNIGGTGSTVVTHILRREG
jgi:acetyl-CoA C-acetyltransferase